MAYGSKTKSRGKVHIPGPTAKSTRATGKITKCMEKASTLTRMEECTKDLFKKEKEQDSEYIICPMATVMKVSGSMGKSMEKAKLKRKVM